jgi:hypothetical protein
MKSTALVALLSTLMDGAIRKPWHSLQECCWCRTAASTMAWANDICEEEMAWVEADRASVPGSEAPGSGKELGCSPEIHIRQRMGNAEERCSVEPSAQVGQE